MWGYVIGAVVAYLLLKEKIATIKRWIKRHMDMFNRWKEHPDIVEAYEKLDAAVKAANLNKRWSVGEVIGVLSLAIALMEKIKKLEEENK